MDRKADEAVQRLTMHFDRTAQLVRQVLGADKTNKAKQPGRPPARSKRSEN